MQKAGFTVVLVVSLVSACSSLSPVAVGDTESAVRSKMGQPTDVRVSTAGENTWEYWRGPAGRSTQMIRFGPDGKVTSVEQALTEDNFRKLARGATQTVVRDLFGRPSYRYRLASGEVWEYRIYDDHARYAKMAVQFGPDGTVTEVSKVLEEFLYNRGTTPIFPRLGTDRTVNSSSKQAQADRARLSGGPDRIARTHEVAASC